MCGVQKPGKKELSLKGRLTRCDKIVQNFIVCNFRTKLHRVIESCVRRTILRTTNFIRVRSEKSIGPALIFMRRRMNRALTETTKGRPRQKWRGNQNGEEVEWCWDRTSCWAVQISAQLVGYCNECVSRSGEAAGVLHLSSPLTWPDWCDRWVSDRVNREKLQTIIVAYIVSCKRDQNVTND